MLYIYQDRTIRIEWAIFKGTSQVREDFSRSLVKLFLIGPNEKHLIDATAFDGKLCAELPQGLPEGEYSIETIYVKNQGNLTPRRMPLTPSNATECHHHHSPYPPHDMRFNDRCIMRSRIDYVFAITKYMDEDNTGHNDVLKFRSSVASYGYDGLSAYEIAVMRGDFNGSEGEWLEHISSGGSGGGTASIEIDSELSLTSTNPVENRVITRELSKKQDSLVNGQNIKTINGQNILGSGNIEIEGSGGGTANIEIDSELSSTSRNPVENRVITSELTKKQDLLQAGVNIKTINGQDIMGAGNIIIEGGEGGGGTISIEDNLTSSSTNAALSANQGRILKGLIDACSSNNESNHTHSNKSTLDGITQDMVTLWNTICDKLYVDSNGYLHSSVVFVGDGEISAYGSGNSGGSGSGGSGSGGSGSGGGSVVVYDGLDSTSANVALSANQGRILKNMIESINIGGGGEGGGNVIIYDGLDSSSANAALSANQGRLLKGLIDTHSSNTELHHTHTNKEALDGITSEMISLWGELCDKLYVDDNGYLHSSVVFIGDNEISAYGSGNGVGSGSGGSDSGGGSVVVYDGLDSTSSEDALSANQGRVLKNMISSISSSGSGSTVVVYDGLDSTSYSEALSANQGRILKNMINSIDTGLDEQDLASYLSSNNYAKKSDIPTSLPASDVSSWAKASSKPSYSYSEISGTPSALPNPYGLTFGSKTYNGSSAATILASDLGALTSHQSIYSLKVLGNGTLIDTYTPNAASKEINITPSSIGATPASHASDTTIHITSSERSNWNTAYNNNHTHSNKSTIDSITSNMVSLWNTICNKMYVDSNGYLHSSVVFIGENEITAYSDERLKENIQTISNRGFVRPVEYDKDGKHSIGFVAQEVQELYPELVTESKDSYLSLNYAQYTAVLQAQIIELNDKLQKMEERLYEMAG